MTPEQIKELARTVAESAAFDRCRLFEAALHKIVHLPDDADLHEAVLIALRALSTEGE